MNESIDEKLLREHELKEDLVALEKSLLKLARPDNSEDENLEYYSQSVEIVKNIREKQLVYFRKLCEEKNNGKH